MRPKYGWKFGDVGGKRRSKKKRMMKKYAHLNGLANRR